MDKFWSTVAATVVAGVVAGIVLMIVQFVFRARKPDGEIVLPPPLPPPVMRVSLGEGTMSDSIALRPKGGALEITIQNKLWLSGLDVYYDGSRQGDINALKTMHLTVPTMEGQHRLEVRAKPGTYDTGRSWCQAINVSQ